MNKLLTILFLSGVIFGTMALMPEGENRYQHTFVFETTPERDPSSLSQKAVTDAESHPASGEPYDNGLTHGLRREFREALERDPLVAVELARQYIFTQELDPNFRLEILRELKILQFTHVEVSELAGEILESSPNPDLFEEALTIKYASMDSEEFEHLVTEISEKTEAPEYQIILSQFGSSERSIN